MPAQAGMTEGARDIAYDPSLRWGDGKGEGPLTIQSGLPRKDMIAQKHCPKIRTNGKIRPGPFSRARRAI